jgi:predicted dehydrogenase
MIKTGICSYGMSGKLFHAPFVEEHPGYELTAIVERTKAESRDRYPASRLVHSVEELIADPSLQLIVVNTPVQTHFDYSKAAMEAGKNVVLEKPATVTVAEIKELAAIAERQNVLFSIYQNRRYDGDYHAVKNIVADGSLGELKEVEMRYDRYRPQPAGKQHKEGALPGAGTLHDLGAHLADQALQLFGMPDSLFADVRTLRPGLESNDYFEILLYYPALRVRIKSTVIARESYYAYVLHGMKGTFLQQRSDLQEEQLLAGVKPSVRTWCPAPASPDGLLHTEIDGRIIREERTSSPGNYMGYYDDVYRAIIDNAPNPVPAVEAINSMRVIEAALKSNEDKTRVNIA